jgi:hypothetical protein
MGRGDELLDVDKARVREEFDASFYLEVNADVRDARIDPFEHYLHNGATELRDPTPNFSTEFYVAKYGHLVPVGMNAFVHYVLYGKALGMTSIPSNAGTLHLVEKLFEQSFYVCQYEDMAGWPRDPIDHFIEFGGREGRDPCATFATKWYKKNHMVGEQALLNPVVHFFRYGIDILYNGEIQLSKKELDVVASAFDANFYSQRYLNNGSEFEPLRHYLTVGWILGYDPNPNFSTSFYLKAYRGRFPTGTNPLVHYVLKGSKSGLVGSHRLESVEHYAVAFAEFDSGFYRRMYAHVRSTALDPFHHYMLVGWKEGTDPNEHFSTAYYRGAYPDVCESSLVPLVHYVMFGRDRKAVSQRPYLEIAPDIHRYTEAEIFARCQDLSFPLHLETTKKLIVLVVPEHNAVSGGIFSMFSIAASMRQLKSLHGYDIAVMTNPNPSNLTFIRQTNFRNAQDVLRFEQIVYCSEVEELYLHIPEYAGRDFLSRCSGLVVQYLASRQRLFINILNQNIELMPEPEDLTELRRIADRLTQSVAHHAYFNQELTDYHQLPTLLLPAYTNLKEYTPVIGARKEDIVIYSLDEAWYKPLILKIIGEEFPNYKLIEIRGISFDHYMDLATRCRFSISFGEGFDGYIAQPIYQGGIGFTLYREEFFPSEEFLRFPNFFSTAEEMVEKICSVMRDLAHSNKRYDRLNKELLKEYHKLYSWDDYNERVLKLARRQFELFPSEHTAT